MSVQEIDEHTASDHLDVGGIGRRSFVGYVLAGTTLVAAADLALGSPARAAAPSGPQIAELYDLNDFITDTCRPTANLIQIQVRKDGTAHFALPRSENGQGIMTSTAMIIAEELDLPVRKVVVTLADARPELLFNQLTGGSTTTTSTYTPIRVAAAIARGALLDAAAVILGDESRNLIAKGGVVQNRAGRSVDVRRARRGGRREAEPTGRGDAQGDVGVPGHRHRPGPDRRPRRRHRQEAVHDRPQGQGRAADHGLPGTHAQRHPEAAEATRPRSSGCPASRTSPSSTPASRCGPRPSASASTRSGP